jgi:MoCo/4Fe-4S cofactor protein with predicted Tat translocation signal
MSKRIFQHPAETQTGKRYWRSLGQLQDTAEFREWLHREFPQGASELEGGDVSRRNFLQLMGASVALAGMSLSACRRPLKQLVPFTKGVEWSVPGKALFYSSAMPSRQGALPLVVTTYDGRPTKIDGNPNHEVNAGTSDVWAQSAILDLYDPGRSRGVRSGGENKTWDDFKKDLAPLLGAAGSGEGIAVLCDGDGSPSRERLRKVIQAKFPKLKWARFEANGNSLELEACAAAFGQRVEPVYRLKNADIVLSVDRDFLGVEGDVTAVRGFTARRRVENATSPMNRLYVVENRYTLTGGMSDHRLRLEASRCSSFLQALALEVGKLTQDESLSKVASALKTPAAKLKPRWVEECAADLVASKGKVLVLVGQRQPVAVQALGFALNAALGALGNTLDVRPCQTEPALSIAELAAQLKAGKTDALFILGGNPLFNAPSEIRWADAQAAAKKVIHLSLDYNETSAKASWHLPAAHFLEQWGDGWAADGSYVIIQPMILPLFGGWSALDLLAWLGGEEGDPLKAVQKTFTDLSKSARFTEEWSLSLRNGFAEAKVIAPVKPTTGSVQIQKEALLKSVEGSPAIRLSEGEYELVFTTDAKLDDGRHANNGWLQELPDPVTKLTWGNAALISPKAAEALGVSTGDVVTLKIADKAVDIPVLELPGHADHSISVSVGYGRTEVGNVGKGVGVDVFPLLTSADCRFRAGVSVVKTGRKEKLAITQEHGALEGRGADIVRQSTKEEWQKNESNGEYFKKMGIDGHTPRNFSLYTHPPLDDRHQWGMMVDLNTCIGCSACMVACQSENNIPIVGKEQVINGREMHWMRTDRYFASEGGDADEPEMVSQPMMCQHCENAPCETVCPVNATVHSEDGVNVMAYNRCIGTRYCANNCPFKVRRFNFFDYNQRSLTSLYKWNLLSEKGTPETIQMQKNPNVTVRMRGVMEKCTFCVQRIQEAKIAAKVHSGPSEEVPLVPADAFTTACAQACPADAIVFGDLKNSQSRISRLKKDQRGYRLLEYLNTENRVWYLARVRNPNPRMPDAQRAGSASRDSHAHHAGDHGHAEQGKPSTGGQH